MNPNAKSGYVNCAIYTRVSVDEGIETQSYSTLDNQRDSCAAFIESQKSKGWKAFKVYEDSGQSGGSLNRPALKQLIHDIERGQIQNIIVYKIDRLTRNHKDFYALLEIFNKHDVKFISTTQNFDTSTPSGRLLLHLMLEFAQFEREMAQERTYDKRFAMARKGIWCGGFVPLGYSVKDKKLVVNKEEAKIVQQCFELYSKLARMSKVAQKLNDMGYRSKRFFLKGNKATGSTQFDKRKISFVISNPVYIGKIRFRDKHGKNYIFDGEHKPLITDMKLWESCQNILTTNRETHKTFKQNKYELLFLGLVRCGECGSIMTNCSKAKKGKLYLYYRCTKVVKNDKTACGIRTVTADELEEFLIDKFKELGSNEKLLKKSIEKSNMLAKKGVEPLRKEKEQIEKQLSKIMQELKRIVDTIKSMDLDKKQSRYLVKEMTDFEVTREKLESELHRVDTNIRGLTQEEIDKDLFIRLFHDFPKVFETFSFDEKRNLILLLVKEVIYTPTKIIVQFWGELPEMNLDLKNLPNWAPPYTSKNLQAKSVDLTNKTGGSAHPPHRIKGDQVRMRVKKWWARQGSNL